MEIIKRFSELFESRIQREIAIPKDILVLSEIFKTAGEELYLVGGAVRDTILGKKPKDFDLATNATPDRIKEIIGNKYKILLIGEAFGVIAVITPEFPKGIEIATFRSESYRDSTFQEFIEYIKKNKPKDYEKRLHLFFDMSNK